MSIEAVLLGAGAALSAFSAISAGSAQASAAETAADQAERDAQVIRQKREFDQSRFDEETRSLLGSQIAAAAASGIDPGYGSALEVQQRFVGDRALERLAIGYTADINEQSRIEDAAARRAEAKSARRAGVLRAGGALLGGAGRVKSVLDDEAG